MLIKQIKKIFQHEIKFIRAVTQKKDFFNVKCPEIAFIGKSNVGKSSLINKLCNNKKIARVSKTPGCTKAINFFSLNHNKLILVDFPGYGFASRPVHVQQQWESLILYYFKTNLNVKLTNLLIDARRGIKYNDVRMIKLLLNYNVNFQIIFTKLDKINNKKNLETEIEKFSKIFTNSCNVFYTSYKKEEGIKDLLFSFNKYIE